MKKIFLFFIVISSLLIFIIIFFIKDSRERYFECSEEISEVITGKSGKLSHVHTRIWNDYEGENRCFKLSMSQKEYLKSRKIHYESNWKIGKKYNWEKIYQGFIKADQHRIDSLVNDILRVKQKYQLNKVELLEYLMSMVQDIPYKFLDPNDCSSIDGDCQGYIKYGVNSPIEFAYTLVGDCDTRALFLYVVFERLGVDSSILISKRYSHAMLGVNYPFGGKYVAHQGKKFYCWETTAKGWLCGLIPADCHDINNWKVALD